MILRIRTLARNVLRGFLNTPGFFVLVIMLLGIPWWASNMAGDGTAEGKFKVFITYSFLLTSIVLTVANIGLSSFSISKEWKKKTLFLLDVKPIKRWEIIIGKWLGLLEINVLLLTFFFLSMAGFSLLVSRQVGNNFSVGKNIFVTYREVFPSHTGEIGMEKGNITPTPEMQGPNPAVSKENYPVPPRGQREWRFRGLRVEKLGRIELLYRFHTSQKTEQTGSIGYWLVGGYNKENPYEMLTEVTAGKVHRLLIPPEAVSENGELKITYQNVDPQNLSILFSRKDFKVLYPAGNYWLNLLGGMINLILVMSFICALGILFSCLTSTLTAVIATSVFVLNGYLHSFISLIYKTLLNQKGTQGTAEITQWFSQAILRVTLFLLPPLNKALPHTYIGDSLLLPITYLAALLLRIVVVGTVPLLFFAILYLSRRELGVLNE